MRIPEGWTLRNLQEHAKVIVSPVDKKSNPEEQNVLLCNYMDAYSNERITADIDFMQATASAREIAKYSLNKGDVLITKDSETPDDIAIPAYVSESLDNVLCGYHLAILRSDKTALDGAFLAYCLASHSCRCHFSSRASGATRFGLTVKSICEAPVLLPPLPEQKKIAAILSSVDETIQATRDTIEQTKKVKQGLMQELLTRGIGHRRFKKTEIGEIPEEWEVCRLLDVAHVVEGLVDPTQAEYRTLSLIAPNHIESGTGRILNLETAEDQRAISGKYEFMPRDVLYSKIRPYLRKVAYASFRGLCSADMYALRCDDELHPNYLAHLLLSEDFTKFANSVSMRTGIPKLNRSELGTYFSARPPITEQNRIVEILSSIDDHIQVEESGLQQLQLLKKGLMQGLLTGKVRVAV